MKIIVLIIGLLLFFSQGKEYNIDVNNNWTEYYSKDSIPESLTNLLHILYKKDFKIANPDEKFNATDVIFDKNLPDKQLVFLAKKK